MPGCARKTPVYGKRQQLVNNRLNKRKSGPFNIRPCFGEIGVESELDTGLI